MTKHNPMEATSGQRAMIVDIPEDMWIKLLTMTPPEFSVQDTILLAIESFIAEDPPIRISSERSNGD